MSQITLMIKPSDIIGLTQFNGNIDADSLNPMIFIAQTTHLKAFLGTLLYNKIYTDFVADSTTGVFIPNNLSGFYLVMYEDYIKDILSYVTSSLFVSFGGFKVSENGLHKIAGENMTSLDDGEINRVSLKYDMLVAGVESNFKEYVYEKDILELKEKVINVNTSFPWQ
tara:strand:+ start:345 stop:848 length:504 start_codon:yes stop_codon:yes gene_type:complete